MSGSPGASSGKQLQLKGDIPKYASVGAICVFHVGPALASCMKYLKRAPAISRLIKEETLVHFENALAACEKHLQITKGVVQDCCRLYVDQSAELLTASCARLSALAHGTEDGTCWYAGCDDPATILSHFDGTLGALGESDFAVIEEDFFGN